MISIDDVTVAYGGYVLLDKINFSISDSDKIGLVGKNGAGKSTILKLICGLQNPTSGHIDKSGDVSIGYLPQIMEHHRGRTVMEEAMTAFESTAELEAEINRISSELAERTDYESSSYLGLIERMNDLNDRLLASHSEPPEVQARRTLLGLGFRDDELGRLTETFSQGWNMRIELAKILLRQPRVLLLDEPTNHLDIESIEWLEQYLRLRKCSIVLVSHDRKFLDTVTNRTVEVMLGKIHDYKVPYTKYLELRKERLAQQTAAYENQQKMIQKTEEFIQAFRYKPTKSNQVQSRIKALEKLDRLEIDETDNATLSVKFPPAQRSGDVVFKAEDLTAAYPQKTVFRGADIEVKRGEKVALVGRNGEGKTTLMRIIVGELAPAEGSARIGHNVDYGYFAQNQEDVLDKTDTVFGTLDRIAVGDIRTRLRDILAQFLFRGEDIDKRVAVLSGGERARLGMAKLMLQQHNLLLLDEPTNHMDIKSKDILKQALAAYDGTLVVVSHDRDFLDGLVDKIYEFRDGRVREHLGGIRDYLFKCKMENLEELDRKAVASDTKSSASNDAVKSADQNVLAAKGGFVSKEQRKLQTQISRLEEQIAQKEAQLKAIEDELSAPSPQTEIMKMTQKYLDCKQEVDTLTSQWEELMMKLEQ